MLVRSVDMRKPVEVFCDKHEIELEIVETATSDDGEDDIYVRTCPECISEAQEAACKEKK